MVKAGLTFPSIVTVPELMWSFVVGADVPMPTLPFKKAAVLPFTVNGPATVPLET